MATFTVKRWNEFETDDPSLTLVPPEHHPYAWLAPRWWYRGERTIYETCAKVVNSEYQIYIDGYTPAMEIEVTIGGGDIDIPYFKNIRRMAITQDYAELLKPDGQYLDIDFEWQRGEYRVVKNDLPDTTPIDNPVTWLQSPTYILSGPTGEIQLGKDLYVINGSYEGGNPSASGKQPFLRGRWQTRDVDGNIGNSPWTNLEELAQTAYAPFVEQSWWVDNATEIRYQNQVRDYKPGTENTRNTNKFLSYLTIMPPDPITAVGKATLSGTFQVGETIYVDTLPDFSGGLEPVKYEYQFQKSPTGTGATWSGFEGPWDEYDPSVISPDSWVMFDPAKPVTTEVPSLLLTAVAEDQYIRLQTRATGADDDRLIMTGEVYGPCLPEA